MSQSELEVQFIRAWRAFAPEQAQLHLPPHEQYRFAAHHVGMGPGIRRRLAVAGLRDWRFDFAWPRAPHGRLAVEIDGGQWMPGGGRHNSDDDRWKLNAAATLGWRVMRYSPTMLEDPARCVREVCAALELWRDR